jgi:hypothetical protein
MSASRASRPLFSGISVRRATGVVLSIFFSFSAASTRQYFGDL